MTSTAGVPGIFPGGDVVLVCGGSSDTLKSKIPLVSSQVFRKISQALNALLDAHVQDDATLSSTTVVMMQEVDPEAMHHVCSILHEQHDRLPTSFTVAQLVSIAALAYKYDLEEALGPHFHQWCRGVGNASIIYYHGHSELSGVAVVFGESAIVSWVGARLLKTSGGTIEAPEEEPMNYLAGFFEELESICAATEDKLYYMIAGPLRLLVASVNERPGTSCNVAHYNVAGFMKALSRQGLDLTVKRKTKSLDKICGHIEDLEVRGQERCPRNGANCSGDPLAQRVKRLKKYAMRTRQAINSLT